LVPILDKTTTLQDTHGYSEGLVLRVNEVYHDVEGRLYEDIHPEIFIDEKQRWEDFGRKLGQEEAPRTILDVGSGTGFVPLAIGGFLKPSDRVVCSDISQRMLDICRENVSREGFRCAFEYVKLDGRSLPVGREIDCITMNSVLHHIPDIAEFFSGVDSILKVGGRIVIAHEPNRIFFSHPFLWNNYRFLSVFVTPKNFAAAVLRRLGLMEPARRFYSKVSKQGEKQLEVMREVNDRLLEEGAIRSPLTSAQMTELVDIHSPMAGGHHKDRGIDMDEIAQKCLRNYSTTRFETYNHLHNLASRRPRLTSYEKYLERKFPGNGATIFAILQKEHG